ncbi:hypothetical protein ACIHDR_25020 [Nocardia sp. NPDC052278]|uniref:hypothetical protein n=1 Tax=unclassified Nocardia TaxID=2637762 RepID=UPI0036B2E1F6
MATATGLLGYQLADKNRDLAELKNAAQTAQQAEQSALTYATGAATMDYKDLAAWHKKLVVNTSPDLSAKLSEAATSMEQVITPLSWTSTAQPIAAQVKSHNGDSYTVVAFVNVTTKNAQAPDGVQSTAAYTVTMDRAKNWLITDVGGMAPIGPK